MAMAANEKFDLVWTASWANPYQNNALKGGYLELDELLDQVPEMRDFYADYIWDATRISNKIYGVPIANIRSISDNADDEATNTYKENEAIAAEIAGTVLLETLKRLPA